MFNVDLCCDTSSLQNEKAPFTFSATPPFIKMVGFGRKKMKKNQVLKFNLIDLVFWSEMFSI